MNRLIVAEVGVPGERRFLFQSGFLVGGRGFSFLQETMRVMRAMRWPVSMASTQSGYV
jgi:hypothetical protein